MLREWRGSRAARRQRELALFACWTHPQFLFTEILTQMFQKSFCSLFSLLMVASALSLPGCGGGTAENVTTAPPPPMTEAELKAQEEHYAAPSAAERQY